MNHRILIILLLTTLTKPLQAQWGYRYKVESVIDNVYVLRPQINEFRWVTANIVVVVNDDDVLVVDSGLLPEAGREAIKEIKRITDKPVKYLVNTHWHGDHWQGNEAFVEAYPGIEIIATDEGAKGIRRDGMVWANLFYEKNFNLMIASYEERLKSGQKQDGTKYTVAEKKNIEEGIALVKRDLEEVKKLKPQAPTLSFTGQMTLHSGNREFQFHYLGRGNTKGDCVIFLPQEKLLITGDLVVHPSPYESGSFSLEWLETSKQLATFPYSILIPGHGEVQHDTSYLDFLNSLFAEIIKQVNQAYLKGSYSLEEFQKLVNHESVMNVLNQELRFAEHAKRLNAGFIPVCVERVHRRAHDGKLLN